VANVVKHAPNPDLRVRLFSAEGDAVLSVDSRGSWRAESGGRGLQELRDRLAAFGGSLSVERGSGRNIVTARIPHRETTGWHVDNRARSSDPVSPPEFLSSDPPTSEVEP
jgi:glucose-6-phosphate-specific signal transduction histidine kinase